MALSLRCSVRFKLSYKVALIGMMGLVGMSLLGWVGYNAIHKIDSGAQDSLERETSVRYQLVETYDKALETEKIAFGLSDLNRRLIQLMNRVVTGHSRGVAANDVLHEAKGLIKDAELVHEIPGSDRHFPGTQQTLAELTINDFRDIESLIEFELPRLYSLDANSPEYKKLQGEIAVTLARMYFFISVDIDELNANSLTEVETSRQEIQTALAAADLKSRQVRNDLAGIASQAGNDLKAIFIGALVVMGCLFTLFAISLVGPLKRTVRMANDLRGGRVSSRLDLGRRSDEFGSMARALNEFADDLEHEFVGAMQAFARGDFTSRINPKDEQDIIRHALKEAKDSLNKVLSDVLDSSMQVAAGSVQVAESSAELSRGANRSAASLVEIGASMKQIHNQTRQNAENAKIVNKLSTEAKFAADQGNQQMQAMVGAMREISDAGQSIQQIIKVIDEIASQTNLLALNAAIEAARAGQYGKGFAVVAAEVRNLAARSTDAAHETSELIEGTVKKTERGTKLAEQTAAALHEILQQATETSDLTAEIAMASHEQAESVEQVNKELEQIDLVIQQNTLGAEEGTAVSEDLSNEALRMQELLSRFNLVGTNVVELSNRRKKMQVAALGFTSERSA